MKDLLMPKFWQKLKDNMVLDYDIECGVIYFETWVENDFINEAYLYNEEKESSIPLDQKLDKIMGFDIIPMLDRIREFSQENSLDWNYGKHVEYSYRLVDNKVTIEGDTFADIVDDLGEY